MEIRINGTGKIIELSYRNEQGIEMIEDLIENAGAQDDFVWDGDDTCWADQATVDWWLDYIQKDHKLNGIINALSEGQGIPLDVIMDYIQEAFTDDWNDHFDKANFLLSELEEIAEPKLSMASDNLLELGYTDDEVLEMTTCHESERRGDWRRGTASQWLNHIDWLSEATHEDVKEWRQNYD